MRCRDTSRSEIGTPRLHPQCVRVGIGGTPIRYEALHIHSSILARIFYASNIELLELTPADYRDLMASPFVAEQAAPSNPFPLVVVTGCPAEIPSPGSLPMVVAAIGDDFGGDGPANADLVIRPEDLADLATAVSRAPTAAVTLAILLRAQTTVDIETGLALESAAYSTVQAGPEFALWRATATHAPDVSNAPTVTVERTNDSLQITLDRPHRHNAISTRVRDELDAALALAEADDSITTVVLRGNGPSFCSGGDLGEFGQRPDVATAHVTRLSRSPARRIHRLRERTSVHLHGASMGGGIELAAFASRVEAHPDTRIALPEIGLGLIPGAGGTASITQRIGRQRTAALGLTGRIIDASTALRWGLVDHIVD